MRCFFLAIALLVCAFSWHFASAQSVDDTPGEDVAPEFIVELIVFEYVGGVLGSREDWRYIDTGRDAAADELRRSQPMLREPVDQPLPEQPSADSAEIEPLPLVFSPVPDSEYRLTDQFAKLRASRNYKPLLHTAWRQAVYDQDNETTLHLAPTALNGDASLYVTRFLHLKLELELAKNSGGAGQSTDSVVYRLNERRKMRSAELHFFDHPRFGALALISRTDQPETN